MSLTLGWVPPHQQSPKLSWQRTTDGGFSNRDCLFPVWRLPVQHAGVGRAGPSWRHVGGLGQASVLEVQTPSPPSVFTLSALSVPLDPFCEDTSHTGSGPPALSHLT